MDVTIVHESGCNINAEGFAIYRYPVAGLLSVTELLTTLDARPTC